MNWLRARLKRYRAAANPLRMERRIELALLFLALLLILQLLYGSVRLALLSAPVALVPKADSLRVISSSGLNAVSAAQSNEIRNRPVLWPGRQPVDNVAEIAPVKNGKPKEFKNVKLVGVFGAGDSAGIIVRVEDKVLRIQRGEELAGWKLESIGKNEAVFAAGGRQEELALLPGPSNSADKVNKRSELKQ